MIRIVIITDSDKIVAHGEFQKNHDISAYGRGHDQDNAPVISRGAQNHSKRGDIQVGALL
jgi:arginine deiminase